MLTVHDLREFIKWVGLTETDRVDAVVAVSGQKATAETTTGEARATTTVLSSSSATPVIQNDDSLKTCEMYMYSVILGLCLTMTAEVGFVTIW